MTSPKTNLAIDSAQTTLFPNLALRGVIEQYRATKQQEWEEKERRWREAGGADVRSEEEKDGRD